jgi:hypothetical protein
MRRPVGVTRRKLAAVLAAGPVLASAAPPQTGSDESALLKTARDRMKSNADALAKEQIPMQVEPAVTFRVE